MEELMKTLNESTTYVALQETYDILMEKSVVKMDKSTLKKRLLTQATLLAAKEAGAQEYIKYVKHSKAKRHYRKLIQDKYGAKGRQKYNEFIKAHKALQSK